MLTGELYRPVDPELRAEFLANEALLSEYNAPLGTSPDARRKLLAGRLGFVGEGAVIRPPFFCDYGFNIRLGRDAFLNFNGAARSSCPVSPLETTHSWRPARW
jgi:maltose O-acetyltransferase